MSSPAPWLAHYDAGVPPTLAPYPSKTLVDYLADAARERPDAPALLFKGATISYGALDALSDACAAAFASLGVRRGDRVALLLPNCPQFFIAELGAWKLGAIVAPLNPTYTEREIEGPLREHGVETIVTLTRYYARVKNIQKQTPLRRVIATNIKDYFPPLLRMLFTLLSRKARRRPRVARAGRPRFRASAAREPGRRPAREPLTLDDPAVLLMSGGTTGTPKGVLGTHGAYTRTGLQVHAWTSSVLGMGDSVILLPLPLFHVYANVGVQSLAFVTRNPIALVPNPRDLPDLLKTIRRVKPAFFTGVPTLYIALLNHPDVQRRQGRLQVDQNLFLRRGRVAGRHQTTLRGADRRPDRRRLLAHRSDDGVVRQSGAGPEQDRLGRHAAARRPRADLRRRRGHARAAGEGSRRDRLLRRRS